MVYATSRKGRPQLAFDCAAGELYMMIALIQVVFLKIITGHIIVQKKFSYHGSLANQESIPPFCAPDIAVVDSCRSPACETIKKSDCVAFAGGGEGGGR